MRFSGPNAVEQALGADSPSAGFFVKLRGRAAQAQRSTARAPFMKLLLTGLMLFASTSTVLTQHSSSPCNRVKDTDWERDELCGRVNEVRAYKTWFKKDDRSGKSLEGERELEEQATYDRSGNQTARKNVNEVTGALAQCAVPRSPAELMLPVALALCRSVLGRTRSTS
jgi:hypothetical protein